MATVDLTTQTINVTVEAGVSANYVAAGTKLLLDGASGDTYLLYNATSHAVELWVDGVKKAQWN